MFNFFKNKKKENADKMYNQYDEISEETKLGISYENKNEIEREEKIDVQKRVVEVDEYFIDSARLVIEMGTAWVGALQKEFGIGLNRASRIIDQLCEEKIIGKSIGERKPRKVLMTKKQFEKYLSKTKIKARKNDEIINSQEEVFASEERVNMYHNQYDYMTGKDFEIFVAQILRGIGFSNIQLTKGSGDQGVDIIAERDGIKYAVQCKRYSQAVGNKAVQEVFAGKSFYHCHVGVVVTNNYFTQSAKELARENGVVLWNRDFLNKYIGSKQNGAYANSSDDGSLRILDVEERIVVIEDGQVSKALYQYLDSTSRIAIDMYLRDGDGNPYTEDMIRNVEMPIMLYNVKFVQLFPYYIHFAYYCGMNDNFRFTEAFKKLSEASRKNNNDYKDDLFQIDVFYGIEDIALYNKEIKIIKMPEIDILTDNMERIKILEDIDEYDEQIGSKYLVTENFFPMKIDNIKISS